MNSWLVFHNVTHQVYLREAQQQRFAHQVQAQMKAQHEKPPRRPRRR